MKRNFQMNPDKPEGDTNKVAMQGWNMNRTNKKPDHKPISKVNQQIFEVLRPLIAENSVQSGKLPSELFNDFLTGK